jgi:hypothetical protein
MALLYPIDREANRAIAAERQNPIAGSASLMLFAVVAQLVERRLPKPKVAGSTPVRRF